MKKCPQCLSRGEEFCPVCKGNRKDPRNTNNACTYCNGKGYVKCNICEGKGQIADNDDYRRS
jgi:hypothetical protein